MGAISYGSIYPKTRGAYSMTEKEYKKLWEEVKVLPDKAGGRIAKVMTNEEEWILYLSYDRLAKRNLVSKFKIGKERLKNEYDRLKEQGGPKGPRPDYMK